MMAIVYSLVDLSSKKSDVEDANLLHPTLPEMDGFLFSGLGCKELFSNEEVIYVIDDWHLLQDKIRVSDLPEVVFKSDDNQIDVVFTTISFKDLVLDLPQHIACGVLAQARSQYLQNSQENENGIVHIVFTPNLLFTQQIRIWWKADTTLSTAYG